jgi:hypothetical protein
MICIGHGAWSMEQREETDGRWKREEGRGKMEAGRGKREEGSRGMIAPLRKWNWYEEVSLS